MLNKFASLACAVLALSAATASAYSSLEELMRDMNSKQVEAIRAYIAENPEAADIEEARERLMFGLISIEDYSEAIEMLDAKYKALPEDKSDLDLSMAFGEIVVPMIQLLRMAEREEDSAKFIEQVRGDFKDHEMVDTINEALDEFSKVFDAPGTGDRLEIKFTAIDGREVDLAAMQGKVVLVDFWATWCVPCLRAMPDVKKLYDEFHDKGFEVVGISLDNDKAKLESYVTKEELPWPQHFDGKGWENEFAVQYGIESIPATYLIGPDGAIVARDASPGELREKIAELLAD